MVVIPDTGSNWMVVGGTGCTDCEGTLWDYATSTTYVQNSGIASEIEYSSSSVEGFTAQDSVCILNSDSTTCATGTDIFIMQSQEDLMSSVDGIWGLSSGRSGSSHLASDYLMMNQFYT